MTSASAATGIYTGLLGIAPSGLKQGRSSSCSST